MLISPTVIEYIKEYMNGQVWFPRNYPDIQRVISNSSKTIGRYALVRLLLMSIQVFFGKYNDVKMSIFDTEQ